MRNSSSQTCQFSSSRLSGSQEFIHRPGHQRPPLPPPAAGDDRRLETISTSAGSANALRLPASANRMDAGCRRCSDGIVAIAGQQVVADAPRDRVFEPGKRDLGVRGAGGVDDQRAQPEPALQRTL